jgi:hypothetical protein
LAFTIRCGWGFLYLKYVGKPPPPGAHDAGLAHDLDGVLLAQSLGFFEATLLHLGHDPLLLPISCL